MRLPRPGRGDLPRPREIAVHVRDELLLRRRGEPKLVSAAAPGRLERDVLSLTFDDGPTRANTPEILDLLGSHAARATFFVVGVAVPGHEDLLHRAAAEGHELANHTFSHAHTVDLTRDELRADIERANEVIEAHTGRQPSLVRPPWGKDRRRIAHEARALGMTAAMWSVDSRDARHASREEIAQIVERGVRRGAVVLFHDGGGQRPDTLWALDRVLTTLAARGFAAIPMSELLDEARRGLAGGD